MQCIAFFMCGENKMANQEPRNVLFDVWTISRQFSSKLHWQPSIFQTVNKIIKILLWDEFWVRKDLSLQWRIVSKPWRTKPQNRRHKEQQVHAIAPEELNKHFMEFIHPVRHKYRDDYEPSILRYLVSSIEKLLKKNDCPASIINNE